MITINEHYKKLNKSYLFSQIAKIVEESKMNNPELEIIKLGIGDVTRSLCPAVISAFLEGVDEMSRDESFRGYGPEQGYAFLRELIAVHDYQSRNVNLSPDEIFISDGSKCDVANIQEIFSLENIIAVPDPIYPVYVDTNVMAGRTGEFKNGYYENLHYLIANEDNAFIPPPPQEEVDLIYLCFPNNPTGATANTIQLKSYVDYALEHNALILFDAAYCEYISQDEIPKSIFEIPNAKKCAIEFRSFSKTAGFTGTRCAYTVIPEECRAFSSSGEEVSLREFWTRRHTTKFNGASYPVQKAAAAIYTQEGRAQIKDIIAYYMHNAEIIRTSMQSLDFKVYGGINAPFIWLKTNSDSWSFFTDLLQKTGVVTTPGAGFGPSGEGYIRISAFNHVEHIEKAMKKIIDFL